MHDDLNLVSFVFFCLSITEGSLLYGITYDQTCSSDCSQKSPVPFKCVIKGKAGWKMFEQNLKAGYDGNDNFKAPIMTSVDWYLKSYSTGQNPSLNVSFTVEDDSIKGVLLEFSSPGDIKVKDKYYHENRKFRLFEISTERIPLHKPISIFYDCMTGLDENASRVYEVTLQSLPGARATYYVTKNYQAKSVDWKPAIATSTLSGYKIYVVFEDARPEMTVSQYSVDLMNFDDKKLVQPHQLHHPNLKTSHTFESVNPGKYYVQISVHSPQCSNNICTAISWNVTIPADDDRHSVFLENHDVLTKIVITLASVAGLFIIVVSVICYIVRTRQKQHICCCMMGTSSGAKMDQANNLRELEIIEPLNGIEEESTFVQGSVEEIIYKYDKAQEPISELKEQSISELKPSDKSSSPKDSMPTKKHYENIKPSTQIEDPETIFDAHEENKSLIADDTEVPNTPDINEGNIGMCHSFTADANNEVPSHPPFGNQRPILQRTPWCPVHSRLPQNTPSNTCPVHGSGMHQKYCQLFSNNSRVQLPVHDTVNQRYSPVHRRGSLGYEQCEQELMRINSLCDISEV
ncbi:hypothetical protein ACJMK2_017286 [Sinanodonta woodiana]|uniref:ILCR1 Ig-like domain-containing protein n=1 Tax=Sinanodonta woodiana TaxID=1069815 RepID=A0ABD3UZR6_SINWO